MSNSSNSISFVCKQNKGRELKRRYFLCNKKKRKKPRMEMEEVATDHKLKQFLADVEKFSERSKHKEGEKKTVKPQSSNKSQEKRGLFENGMLSKPSVKGILGLKNKARLTGNLENLLDEGDKSCISISEKESTKDSYNFDESLLDERRKNLKEEELLRKVYSEDLLGITDHQSYHDPLRIPDPTGKFRKNRNGNPGTSKEDDEIEGEEIDNLIKFAERRKEQCSRDLMAELRKQKEVLRAETRKNVIEFLETRFNKCIKPDLLKKDEEIVKNLKTVCEEYIQSKKPIMVDKHVQTEDCDLSKPLKLNEPTCYTTDNVCSPEKTNFFDNSNIQHTPEKPFSFHPTRGNKSNLMPQEEVFRRNEIPIGTPQGFKTNNWQPFTEKNDKPYVPSILSPPSPGRKYAMSPLALSNISDWLPRKQHTTDHNDLLMSRLESSFAQTMVKQDTYPNFKKPSSTSKHPIFTGLHPVSSTKNKTLHNFHTEEKFNCNSFKPPNSHVRSKRIRNFENSEDLMDVDSSPLNNFSFPKRSKVLFSPHRL